MQDVAQVGAGGVILGLWIVREVGAFVLPLIKSDRPDYKDEFWKAEVRKAVIEAIGPIMATQTEILREMNQNFKVLTKTATYVEEMFRQSVR